MPRKESLAEVADRVIPCPVAARWAGVDAGGRAKAHCPFGFEHDDGGREQALRVYDDHGWCFAEQRYFTVTLLLAAVWGGNPGRCRHRRLAAARLEACQLRAPVVGGHQGAGA